MQDFNVLGSPTPLSTRLNKCKKLFTNLALYKFNNIYIDRDESKQGIEDIQEQKLGKIFSCMLTTAKIVKELSTPALNGISVSVRCVSSTLAVICAGLNDQSQRK